MKRFNVLTWTPFGALIIAAACAQGTSGDTNDGADAGGATSQNDEDGSSTEGDSGSTVTPSEDSGSPFTGEDTGTPANEDSGTPNEDSGGNTGDDAGQDSAPPGHDAGGGTDSGGGSQIPTTCAQAYQAFGCCVGNTLYYCSGGSTPTSKTCTGTKVCGWNATDGYYDCVASPGGADPGGTHPIACE